MKEGMASPPDNPVKNIRTELYRDQDENWYRIFMLDYTDGSGQIFKFRLDSEDKS